MVAPGIPAEQEKIQRTIQEIMKAFNERKISEIKTIWARLSNAERKAIQEIANLSNVGRVSRLKQALDAKIEQKPERKSSQRRRLP